MFASTPVSDKPRLGALLLNGTLFNISWVIIVLTQSVVFALMQVTAHLLVHFLLLGRGMAELRLVLLVSAIGLVLDQILFLTGVFTLDGRAALAPLKLPGDAVVMIGTRAEERAWADSARLARFLPAEGYFPAG